MGIKDAFKGMFSNDEEYEENYNDEEYYDDYEGQDENAAPEDGAKPATSDAPEARGFSVGAVSDKVELRVVRPTDSKNATIMGIADHLLKNRTVILNYESINNESARRMLDFLTGVTYAIKGGVKTVGKNTKTCILTPGSVIVSEDQVAEAVKSAGAGEGADSFDEI